MQQDKYNVDWYTYSFHLREMLENSLKTHELADVTLVCDDKRQFKAHKIILGAFSSVFKSIITDLPATNSFVYLKGIQHQELEVILEYMYLGVTTFNQERMNEFLEVAKNLEIKGITEAFVNENRSEYHEVETPEKKVDKSEAEECNSTKQACPSDFVTLAMNSYKSNIRPNNGDNPEIQKSEQSNMKSITKEQSILSNKVFSKDYYDAQKTDGLFSCNQCDKQFSTKKGFQHHFESIHEGVKYGCDQCDYKTTTQSNLTVHIKAKHEGIKYDCNQCNYRATFKIGLKHHIASKHEGVKYACKECDYQATQLSHLKTHIRVKHKGVMFACEKCNQQFGNQNNLYIHMKRCGIAR